MTIKETGLFGSLRQAQKSHDAKTPQVPPLTAGSPAPATVPVKTSKKMRNILLGTVIAGLVAVGGVYLLTGDTKRGPVKVQPPKDRAALGLPAKPAPGVPGVQSAQDNPSTNPLPPGIAPAQTASPSTVAPAAPVPNGSMMNSQALQSVLGAAATSPGATPAPAAAPVAPPAPAQTSALTAPAPVTQQAGQETSVPGIAPAPAATAQVEETKMRPQVEPDHSALSPVKPTSKGGKAPHPEPHEEKKPHPAPATATGQGGEKSDRQIGDELLEKGDFNGATTAYTKDLVAHPNDVAPLMNLANVQELAGNWAGAVAILTRAVAAHPGETHAMERLLTDVMKLPSEQALQNLRQLQGTHGAVAAIPANIAKIEADINQVPAAVAAMVQACQLAPNNGYYRLNLAILQDRAGMLTEAVASYDAAITMLGNAIPEPSEPILKRFAYLSGKAQQ